MSIDFDSWSDVKTVQSSVNISIQKQVPLAERIQVSKRLRKRFIHRDREASVLFARYSSDGKRLFGSNYPKNNIQVWDADSGKQLLTIDTPDEFKGSLGFWYPNEDFSKAYLWIESRPEVEQLNVDGKRGMKIAYPDSMIQVRSLVDGSVLEKIQADPPTQFRMLTMAPGGKHLIALENLPGTFFQNERGSRQRLLDLETGEWSDWPDSLSPLMKFDKKGQRFATFVNDESKRFITGVSVLSFPEAKEILTIDLPGGTHGLNGLPMFVNDGKHLIVDYRTYSEKGNWNDWSTTLACIDLESKQVVGSYEYQSADQDAPLLLSELMANGNLIFQSWRTTPKKAFAIKVPSMELDWEMELGDYLSTRETVVSPDRTWYAVTCRKNFEGAEQILRFQDTDWDQVPQNELKIISQDGKLLETITLPVGAANVSFSEDGKRAVVCGLGSVYEIDLSSPFQNE